MSRKRAKQTSVLGNLTPKEFLKKYWQKRPVLIRNAFPGPLPLLTPDEMAGLACDPDVNSRLILERGGRKNWELRSGPFKASLFRKLPRSKWTLLVNNLDTVLPDASELLDRFDFIPQWRIDDVMVSYAPKGGSVGAHVDNYDVFLIQGRGRRQWQIESKPQPKDDFIEGLDIRLLKRFKPDKTWVLKAGDMLYLPPRVPHHGVSMSDDCMTYSVGFRAPSHAEMIESLAAKAVSMLTEELRYADPDLGLQPAGEITPSAIRKVRTLFGSQFLDETRLSHWFGGMVTEVNSEAVGLPSQRINTAGLRSALKSGSVIRKNESSRIAYVRTANGQAILFANGVSIGAVPQQLARRLTDKRVFSLGVTHEILQSKFGRDTLLALINQGVLYLKDEE